MVSRTAYAQLRYSPLLLAGNRCWAWPSPISLPVLLAVFADGLAQILGLAAWLLMALAFQPTLRFYRVSPLWGLALPAIAAIYMAFTLDSAYQHARGRGGMWKGRAQANVQATATQRFGIAMNDASMSDATNWRSGKGHRDENFPVASWLIHPRHRGADSGVLQFRAHRRRHRRPCDACAGGEARPARSARRRPRSARTSEDAAAVRLRTALAERALSPRHAQDLLAAFQARRHQAPLSRLGRSDRLLLAVGDAGRPLRARRARREPRHLAGQRRAVRGAADHQSSAGLPSRLPQSRPRLYSARPRSPRAASASKRSASRRPRRRCLRHCTASPNAPGGFSPRATCFRS